MQWSPFLWEGEEMKELLICYVVSVNLLGLFLMWEDKRRARKSLWRIPERTLFLCSILGGGMGTWVGMYLFRHKTRRWYFVCGMPLILLLEVCTLLVFVKQSL